MRQLLTLHPDSRSSKVTQIEVDVAQPRADQLMLSYGLTGQLDNVLMPPAAASVRSDKLWQHTCFEAFVRPSAGPAYYEFNFAPSTQWAAYQFSSYRSGRSMAVDVGVSIIEVQSSPDRCTLQARLEFSRNPGFQDIGGWHLGLAAVVEEVDHQMSYWALAHPPGKPDFHHAACFELIPPVSP